MAWAPVVGAGISALSSAFGGGNKSGSPTWLRKASKRAVGRAEELSNRPYHAYGGQRVAGLDPNERLGGQMARHWNQRLNPYLSNLRSSMQFDPSQLSQYENPYLDRVLSARQRVIGEEYGRQLGDLKSHQSAMDAFRTGRSDLARSRLEKNRMQSLDDAEGEARAGAFDSAMQSYLNQRQLGVQGNLGALGALGDAQRDQYGALMSSGGTRRGIAQGQMDFDYGQFLEGRDWDVNNFGVVLDALRAAHGSAGNGDTGPSNGSLLGGLLGTVVSNMDWSGFGNGGFDGDAATAQNNDYLDSQFGGG